MDQQTFKTLTKQLSPQKLKVKQIDSPTKIMISGQQSCEKISQKHQTYYENILEQKAYIKIDVQLQKKIQKIIELHKNKKSIIEEQRTTIIKSCRICLSDQSQELISPCKCKGSIKDVHQECLKMWIIEKIKQNEQEISDSSCEVCGEKFQMQIIQKNKFIPQMFLQQRISSQIGECCIMLLLIALIITSSVLINYLAINGLQLAYLFLACFCSILSLIFFYLVFLIIHEIAFVQIIDKWVILNVSEETNQNDVTVQNQNNSTTLDFRSRSTPMIRYSENKIDIETSLECLQVL